MTDTEDAPLSLQAQLAGLIHRPEDAFDIANAIIEDPTAIQWLPQVPSPLIHRLVCEIGLGDASELMEMASGEQVREVLDMEIWQGDRLKMEETLDWVHFLSSLSDEVAMRHIHALDIELLGCLLLRWCRIYLLAEVEPPDEPEGSLWTSPDGWFAVEVLAHSQAQVDQMNDLLDKLYREEQEETRQLLQNLIWEMPSELEEWSYRWRGARLEDLGFADPQESLLIYAYLDPGSVTPDERTADQSLKSDAEPVGRISGALTVQGPASDGSFWSRATVALEDEAERERISQALLSLANRALAADRVSPGDTEAVQASLNDLHWRLSIGLEQICKGDLSRSGAALSGIALIRLARVGHSLGLDLHRALLPLQRAGKLGPRPGNAARLDPPLRHQVEALLRPRPRFLDDKTGQTRAFRGLSDLKESRRWVQAAEASVLIMDRLSLPDPFPADASLGDIFRTRLVNLMLDRDDGPLDRDALGRFIDRHISGHKLDNDARLAAAALAERGGVTPSFVDGWLQVLESSLGPLDRAELDLRFIDGLWLLGDQPG